MHDWLSIFLITLIGFGIAALLYWLLIETEGVFLGQRVVTWLYNRYARRYDEIKRFVPQLEVQHLSQPLMQEIAPNRVPKVLDVAAGTGRMPVALLRLAGFSGHVIGVDLSLKMLAIAVAKTDSPRVSFICAPAERLPFPDQTFDVVTCLEALEFMANSRAALCEMARVLKPDGVLLATNRLTGKWMFGRRWSAGQMQEALEAAGFVQIQFERWQVDYEKVWARKPLT
ncbi:MAG: methyltransferase domain-containing protein [Anaerolineae bacterium]|nr:methyltransferase domain-containing protein [Anaerolineae bacterium]